MKQIQMMFKDIGIVRAELLEAKCPKTCELIWDALPFEVSFSKWGDEFYGTIPIKCPAEHPTEECKIGDIGYWLEGSGFCIFFGPTPVSTNENPRAASPVNIFASVIGDPSIFKKARATKIKITKG